ncbi:tryptophan synthase beta chain [Vigna unguiculata]|uniref:Tryptophan synthase beta chain n=1 Tax=Vigna unguiculata TaxID=3917 RepID=A0A4D6M3D6_VIGUN|nr:tryptophan synthase beta chain [Vigna unguiculata]
MANQHTGSVHSQQPDSFGRFGRFGGKYVPETLMSALTELEAAFDSVASDEHFQVLFSLSHSHFNYQVPPRFSPNLQNGIPEKIKFLSFAEGARGNSAGLRGSREPPLLRGKAHAPLRA